METNSQSYKNALLTQVKDAYGRLLYTYTVHLKQARIYQVRNSVIKWLQIILSALSTCGLIAIIITNSSLVSILSGICTTILLVISTYSKDINLDNQINEHCTFAHRLWIIKERYITLLTDFPVMSPDQISNARNELQLATAKEYAEEPPTSKKSYKKAQKALKKEEEQYFAIDELNQILPPHLRSK